MHVLHAPRGSMLVELQGYRPARARAGRWPVRLTEFFSNPFRAKVAAHHEGMRGRKQPATMGSEDARHEVQQGRWASIAHRKGVRGQMQLSVAPWWHPCAPGGSHIHSGTHAHGGTHDAIMVAPMLILAPMLMVAPTCSWWHQYAHGGTHAHSQAARATDWPPAHLRRPLQRAAPMCAAVRWTARGGWQSQLHHVMCPGGGAVSVKPCAVPCGCWYPGPCYTMRCWYPGPCPGAPMPTCANAHMQKRT